MGYLYFMYCVSRGEYFEILLEMMNEEEFIDAI